MRIGSRHYSEEGIVRLKDKVAIITGGSSSMGRASAELIAEKGAKVVIGGRRKAQGEWIAESIRQGGGQSIFIQTDVGEAEQVENLVQQTISTFRKIDILFNNAGIHNHGPGDPHDEDINIYDHVLNVNLKGAFLCTKYVVPPMIKNNGVR